LDQLRAGRAVPRRYRNRRIGEFLKELDITEGRSTGIPKILNAMKRNGSPLPEFEFDPDHSYFMTRLPVHPQARVTEQAIGQDTNQLAHSKSATQSPTQSSDPIQRLLIALLHGGQSSSGLRNTLRIKHRPTFRQNYLHPAMQAGLIEPTIPDKPNSRLQKYRLTEKGRNWLSPVSEKREGRGETRRLQG
jgi:ATP-dependent DNA helicase RecG